MASFKRVSLRLVASPSTTSSTIQHPTSSSLFFSPSIHHPHTTHHNKEQKPMHQNKNTNTQPSLQSPLHHNTTHSPSFVPFFQPLTLLPSSSPVHSNSSEATFPTCTQNSVSSPSSFPLCHSPLILPSIALTFSYHHHHLTTTTPSSSFSTVSSLRHPSSSPSFFLLPTGRTSPSFHFTFFFPTDPPTADPSRLRKP